MEQDRDEAVRARAHSIWEAAGRPEGDHEDHWRQAVEELEMGGAQMQQSPASAEITDTETFGAERDAVNGSV